MTAHNKFLPNPDRLTLIFCIVHKSRIEIQLSGHEIKRIARIWCSFMRSAKSYVNFKVGEVDNKFILTYINYDHPGDCGPLKDCLR